MEVTRSRKYLKIRMGKMILLFFCDQSVLSVSSIILVFFQSKTPGHLVLLGGADNRSHTISCYEVREGFLHMQYQRKV